jgi:hypothetical protein
LGETPGLVVPRISLIIFGWRRSRLQVHRVLTRHVKSTPRPIILLIGGAGYLGSGLLPRLPNDGYEVRLLDRLMYGVDSIADCLNHPQLQVRNGDFRRLDDFVLAMREGSYRHSPESDHRRCSLRARRATSERSSSCPPPSSMWAQMSRT